MKSVTSFLAAAELVDLSRHQVPRVVLELSNRAIWIRDGGEIPVCVITEVRNAIRGIRNRCDAAIVMSEDGTIISSRQYGLSDQVTYEYFEKVKAVLNDKDYPRSYAIIDEEGEAVRLVGLPETDLMSFFPELKWYIFTDQEIKRAPEITE